MTISNSNAITVKEKVLHTYKLDFYVRRTFFSSFRSRTEIVGTRVLTYTYVYM